MSKYFQGLNYSLANEDTWIEHELAPRNAKSIFSVCGSGSRVSPLLAKNPGELHVVDLSGTQLMLFRLRIAAAKNLPFKEYLYFLGYLKESPSRTSRNILIARLKLNQQDLKYWRSQEELWKLHGFIYLGKWERHFMNLGKFYKILTFSNMRPIFEANSIEEQRKALKRHWSPKLFRRYCQLVMNEWVANKFLYKGQFAGADKIKTLNMSTSEFIFHEFSDLFYNTWVRGNYFLQMIFLNEIAFPEAYPCECNEGIFEGIKSSQSRIHFHQENLLKLLQHTDHDFYSLSDTFSYISNEESLNFLESLPNSVKPGSSMVIRTFMRKPSFSVVEPWITNKEQNEMLAKKDCTRMYEFSILTKK